MNKLLGAGGLAAIALFMLLGFLNSSAAETGEAAATVALLLVVGLPALGSGLLARSYFSERARLSSRRQLLRQQTLDAEILRLAKAKGGKLTVVEVATELGVSMEGAKEALDGLFRREHSDLEITDEGVTVYAFHDIRHLGGKDSARGLLDA